jgi:hypothetical protein
MPDDPPREFSHGMASFLHLAMRHRAAGGDLLKDLFA